MWMLPPVELWEQYEEGKIAESEIVVWSIQQYKNNRERIEEPEPDDMPDAIGMVILNEVQRILRQDKLVMESVQTMLDREKPFRRC